MQEKAHEKEIRIFNHYKNILAKYGETRFNVIEYLCSCPKINPYQMAAILKIEGIKIAFDDSSISTKDNKKKEKKVEKFIKTYCTKKQELS